MKTIGRAEYVTASGDDALAAFQELSQVEGIIPALESSHEDDVVMVNLSGRGDKDVAQVFDMLKK